MSWDRPAAAGALVEVLEAATASTVSVFDKPPATFNPPALVINYPTTVAKHNPAFAIDLASFTVLAAVGVDQGDSLDELLGTVTAAVEADPSLTAVVQHAKPVEWRNWRILTVAGADMLAADVALEVRM